MFSIRWKLSVSLALLLAFALMAGSVLAYRTAADALAARTEATAELIRAQSEDRRAEILARFDDDLLTRARTAAGLARGQPHWNRFRLPAYYPLGLLTAAPSPLAPVTMPAWLAPAVHRPLLFHFWQVISAGVTISEDDLPLETNGNLHYDQVNTDWGGMWRSRSLGESALPVQPRGPDRPQLFDWQFDDVTLPADQPGRMVVLWVPQTRTRNRPPDRRDNHRTPAGPPERRPPPPPVRVAPPRPPEPPDIRTKVDVGPPILAIACAATTTSRDAELAALEERRGQRLDDLNTSVKEALAALRGRFLGIGAMTFLTALLGALLLIGGNLTPLRRLGEAVGRVTPNNYALPLDSASLPPELAPIARRLDASLRELGQAFDREKQAAADISHELRTPLAGLLTRIDVVLRKQRTADDYRLALDECREAGRTLKRLVERLLTLSRLDAGTSRPSQRPFDAVDLARSCLSTVQPLADARGLTLDLEAPPAMSLLADPDRLRDVLTNLLHNAIEYNRPQGRVRLTLAREPGLVTLTVSDTGIGMTAETQARVFERFFRADPARRSEGGHAGLGLAIVKASIEQLGGEITVESTPGVGSTFTVRLPAPVDRPRRAVVQRTSN